eukprot:12205129-Alexandrium_andersonii.AAC.1
MDPPRPPPVRAQAAPRRVNLAKELLEEHGYTAGCLKCTRVRTQRPSAGTRHSEECRARFEAILRAAGDASMARADERINEHIAEKLRASVESPGAVGATASGVPGTLGASGSGSSDRLGANRERPEEEDRNSEVPALSLIHISEPTRLALI